MRTAWPQRVIILWQQVAVQIWMLPACPRCPLVPSVLPTTLRCSAAHESGLSTTSLEIRLKEDSARRKAAGTTETRMRLRHPPTSASFRIEAISVLGPDGACRSFFTIQWYWLAVARLARCPCWYIKAPVLSLSSWLAVAPVPL